MEEQLPSTSLVFYVDTPLHSTILVFYVDKPLHCTILDFYVGAPLGCMCLDFYLDTPLDSTCLDFYLCHLFSVFDMVVLLAYDIMRIVWWHPHRLHGEQVQQDGEEATSEKIEPLEPLQRSLQKNL
jgi:hypothetical protein